ncbi:MAG: ABC transporter permease [bacterium]|nr:ABC transporter permease [bacterium]
MFDSLGIEFKGAIRGLFRRPGYSLVSVLILAIGIGAVTVMYTALRGVVLQPLPYPEPDRLVWAWAVTHLGEDNSISALDYFDYRQECDVFESLGAFLLWRPGRVFTGTGEPERVVSTSVSHNFFSTLGVEPMRGRSFVPEEEVLDGPAVVALSHKLWQRRFGGDTSIIGQAVSIDGAPHEVVAVMPESFDFPAGVEMWLPMRQGGSQESGRGNNNFFMFGRLRDGVSIEQAEDQMAAVAASIASTYPDSKKGWSVRLLSLHERFFAGIRPLMMLLMGATGLLLLIACANLSSLSLAGVMARYNEMALRRSLGASGGTIARQLLVESFVPTLLGGVLGAGFAVGGVRLLQAFAPAGLPRVDSIAIDGSVLLVSLAVTCLAGLLFGIAPALQGARIRLAETLREGRSTTESRKGLRLRTLLVSTQVALSLVLLIAAGLLIRSALRLQMVDPGIDIERRLTVNVQLPAFRYSEPEPTSQAFRDILDRIRSTPGVVSAAASDQLPLFGGPYNRVHRTDRPPLTDDDRVPATRRIVTDGFFSTLGVRLLAGREFEAADRHGEAPVVIISNMLAERVYPGENPIGQKLTLPWGDGIHMEIVGVAADVRDNGPAMDSRPVFYLPYHQYPDNNLRLVIESEGEATSMLPAVRAAIREVEQDAPAYNEGTMAGWLSDALSQARFSTMLLTGFAVVALILAATGLYGVMAYFVAERTREIGIRVALGAGPAQVARWIVGRGTLMIVGGVVVGMIAAAIGGRFLGDLLFATSPFDLPTWFSVLVVLVASAVLACLIPAKRALGSNPADAMRG